MVSLKYRIAQISRHILGPNLASVTDLKRIQTPHSLCCDFRGDKTFTTSWSGGRVQVESKFEPLQVIWQSLRSLVQKVIEGLESEINGQALGAALRLARVGRASLSTNTGRFRVGGSRCGPRQARLRKACYHSCDTDSTQSSTRFQCFVNFGPQRVTFFFM